MLAVGVVAAEEITQERVGLAVMEASHLAAALVVVVGLQLAAQVVEVRQVELEFGAGNDIKQYYTIT
jgi:hypothetical protein